MELVLLVHIPEGLGGGAGDGGGGHQEGEAGGGFAGEVAEEGAGDGGAAAGGAGNNGERLRETDECCVGGALRSEVALFPGSAFGDPHHDADNDEHGSHYPRSAPDGVG